MSQLSPSSSSSSWFSSFSPPTNLTDQLSKLSSSIVQTTSKFGHAAHTFVQNSIQQGIFLSDKNDQQTSEATAVTTTANKDTHSKLILC